MAESEETTKPKTFFESLPPGAMPEEIRDKLQVVIDRAAAKDNMNNPNFSNQAVLIHKTDQFFDANEFFITNRTTHQVKGKVDNRVLISMKVIRTLSEDELETALHHELRHGLQKPRMNELKSELDADNYAAKHSSPQAVIDFLEKVGR